MKDPIEVAYYNALARCTNTKNCNYHRYGGRGIEFRFNTLEDFRAEVGERPPGMTIDRINNDGHYEKGNMRWATRSTQRINQTARHQRGYIFEAHNAFHVRYYAEVSGKRKQLSHRLCAKDRSTGHGSPSAKAVRAICEDFMRTVNTDAPTPSEVVKQRTVVSFFNWTYYRFIKRNLKHSTVMGYKQVWEGRLREHFGTTKLRDYRTPMMTKYLTSLAKTLRGRTLQHIKATASSLFAHAVATGECDFNPIRDAMVLGKALENNQTQSYSLEEMENVISALVDRVDCQLMMGLSFFLGLRKCEIGALQWGDLDDKFCHVRRAVVRGVVDTPKTLKSTRSVPLIAPVRLLVGLWQAKQGGYAPKSGLDGLEPSAWVFPSERGTPIDPSRVARFIIQPALKRAGVPWKGFHAGRRGLGTALRTLTGNSNAGRDVLGHSTDQVTQGHYEARMPEEALKGMRLLEAQVSKQ